MNKPFHIFIMLSLLLLLGGCAMPSGDELLAAPQPSTNYQSLRTELERMLAGDLAYATPASGDYRSTVQLMDLDGDGTDEVVAFFRGAAIASSNDFTVCVYKMQEERYVQVGQVNGTGMAIQSVDYPLLSANGQRGILIGWRFSNDQYGLTLCDFERNGAPRVLLESDYSAVQLVDLTGNAAQELLLISTDTGGYRSARLYQYAAGTLTMAGEAAIGQEPSSVVRTSSGMIGGQTRAVFVEEKPDSGTGLQTDIFVYADGALRNLALATEDAAARSTYRPLSVYATDIDGDGVIELPRAVPMAGYTDAAATDIVYMLDWYRYSLDAAPERACTTYQNVAEEWSLKLDPSWYGSITAVKTTETGLTSVQFSKVEEGGGQTTLFTIYCATGSLRNYYAGRSDVVQLASGTNAVFFARISEEAEDSGYHITAERLQQMFSLVKREWNS